MFSIKCPNCGETYNPDKKLLGKKVVCPACSHEFIYGEKLKSIEKPTGGGGCMGAFLGFIAGGLAGVMLAFLQDTMVPLAEKGPHSGYMGPCFIIVYCPIGAILGAIVGGMVTKYRNL